MSQVRTAPLQINIYFISGYCASIITDIRISIVKSQCAVHNPGVRAKE